MSNPTTDLLGWLRQSYRPRRTRAQSVANVRRECFCRKQQRPPPGQAATPEGTTEPLENSLEAETFVLGKDLSSGLSIRLGAAYCTNSAATTIRNSPTMFARCVYVAFTLRRRADTPPGLLLLPSDNQGCDRRRSQVVEYSAGDKTWFGN
jgi:hypothetical protein